MPFSDYAQKLSNLAKTVYQWLSYLADLDPKRRERVARYAEQIANTLGRARKTLTRLKAAPKDRTARTKAIRELSRINGYVETIVIVLKQQLDGRKLAGVKRRLEKIGTYRLKPGRPDLDQNIRMDRLADAEGYFRALADGLRAKSLK